MDFDTCLLQLGEGADALLPAQKEKLRKLLENVDRKGFEQYVRERKEGARVNERNYYLNENIKQSIKDYIATHWADDPAGGLQAIVEGSDVNRPGAKDSTPAHVAGTANEFKSMLISQLDKEGLLDIGRKRTFDKEISHAMYELSKKNPDQGVLRSLPPEALKAAEIFSNIQELMRNRANKVGAWIGEQEGRIMRRFHDAFKVKMAAGKSVLDAAANRKAWMDDVSQWIDWDRTFPDVPAAERMERLGSLYDQISEGYHRQSHMADATGRSWVQKRMSRRRLFHFKDFESDWAYTKKYSPDTSILEGIFNEVDHMGRDVALMEKLGPHFQENIYAVVDDLKKTYPGAKAADLDKMLRKLDGAIIPYLSGKVDSVDSALLAQSSETFRAFLQTVDLGGAAVSQLNDITSYAFFMQRYGAGGGRTMFGRAFEALTKIFNPSLLRKNPAEMHQLAGEMYIALDSIIPRLTKYDVDPTSVGRTSKVFQGLMRATGLPKIAERTRFVAGKMAAYRYGLQVGKKFDEIPTEMRDMFKRYGIEDWEWEIIRKQPLTEYRGLSYLTPGSLSELDPRLFKDRAASGQWEQAAKSLHDKYRGLFTELAYFAEPQAKYRAAMLQGTKRGTYMGELARSFWMYKTTIHYLFKRIFGELLWGQAAERVSTPEALKRFFTDSRFKSGRADLAQMVALSMTIGYLTLTLKDLAKGRGLRDPDEAGDWVKLAGESLAQGGLTGIFGDFLAGEMGASYGSSGLDRLLGPVYGRGADASNLVHGIFQGEKGAWDVLKEGVNNLPGKNLFYTKWLFDYMILNRVREQASPGYIERMQERMMEERGQGFWAEPF